MNLACEWGRRCRGGSVPYQMAKILASLAHLRSKNLQGIERGTWPLFWRGTNFGSMRAFNWSRFFFGWLVGAWQTQRESWQIVPGLQLMIDTSSTMRLECPSAFGLATEQKFEFQKRCVAMSMTFPTQVRKWLMSQVPQTLRVILGHPSIYSERITAAHHKKGWRCLLKPKPLYGPFVSKRLLILDKIFSSSDEI